MNGVDAVSPFEGEANDSDEQISRIYIDGDKIQPDADEKESEEKSLRVIELNDKVEEF